MNPGQVIRETTKRESRKSTNYIAKEWNSRLADAKKRFNERKEEEIDLVL